MEEKLKTSRRWWCDRRLSCVIWHRVIRLHVNPKTWFDRGWNKLNKTLSHLVATSTLTSISNKNKIKKRPHTCEVEGMWKTVTFLLPVPSKLCASVQASLLFCTLSLLFSCQKTSHFFWFLHLRLSHLSLVRLQMTSDDIWCFHDVKKGNSWWKTSSHFSDFSLLRSKLQIQMLYCQTDNCLCRVPHPHHVKVRGPQCSQ